MSRQHMIVDLRQPLMESGDIGIFCFVCQRPLDGGAARMISAEMHNVLPSGGSTISLSVASRQGFAR
jgi:hypothetical protein